MKLWHGEGWYRIGWSDGGMDWTNDGPHWYETKHELDDDLEAAREHVTETHIPWVEYMGSNDEPEEE